MAQRITIKESQQQGSCIVLERAQLHYLRRVLRLQVGDRFIVQDGKGQQWLAALGESSTEAEIIESLAPLHVAHTAAPLRLVAALPKGNSFDQVVRQATELGVTHIYPVMSDRSLLQPSKNKLTRWKRIAEEASEQSERVMVPDVCEAFATSARRDKIALIYSRKYRLI